MYKNGRCVISGNEALQSKVNFFPLGNGGFCRGRDGEVEEVRRLWEPLLLLLLPLLPLQ